VNWRLVGTVAAGMLVVPRASLAVAGMLVVLRASLAVAGMLPVLVASLAAAGVNGTVEAFAVPALGGVAPGAEIRRRSG